MYNPRGMSEPQPSPESRRQRQQQRRKARTPARHSPRMWPSWILVGIAWLIARLPLRVVLWLGARLGDLGYHIGGSRRRITLTNLRLCFPERAQDHEAMARDVFQQVAMGTLELCVAWLNPRKNLLQHCEVEGAEHLAAAQAAGRGVVLVGGHFAVLDTIAQPLSQFPDIDLMYRHNKNPVFEWLQVYGRKHYFSGVYERQETRPILRSLKQGRTIWYAADQDYGAKHSVFAPFFGVPAATITATTRLAKLNGSAVLLLSQHRDAKNLRWRLRFSPVVANYPSGDDVADATRMNALLETEIRREPTQYLWLHKRFKTRPPGEPDLYRDSGA